jgi:hypothetical protein
VRRWHHPDVQRFFHLWIALGVFTQFAILTLLNAVSLPRDWVLP